MFSDKGDNSVKSSSNVASSFENCTKSGVIKFSHRWVIDNFSYFCSDNPIFNSFKLQSPHFYSVTNEKIKFYIGIYPNGTTGQPDSLHAYLYCLCDDGTNFNGSVQFQISILDGQGKACFASSVNRVNYSATANSWGWELMPSNCLHNLDCEFLSNDKLIICCEICYELNENSQFFNLFEKLPLLADDISKLYNNKKLSDLVLVFADEAKELFAHKFILCARSKMFAEMSHSKILEKSTNRIVLNNVEWEVGIELIRFIYTGKCDQLDRFGEKLLSLADKFQIDSLKEECEFALCSKLSLDSVVDLFYLADLHNAVTLKSKAIEYMKDFQIFRNQTSDSRIDELKVFLNDRPKLFYEILSNSIDHHSNEVKFAEDIQMHSVQCESWSHTFSTVMNCSHYWTIEELSTHEKDFYYYHYKNCQDKAVFTYIESAAFFSPERDHIQFHLKFYRNGENEDCRDYLSLFLCLNSMPTGKLAVQLKVFILDSNGKCCYSRVTRSQLAQNSLKCGWPKFINSKVLKRDQTNRFVTNGRLTLYCEVFYIENIENLKKTFLVNGQKSQLGLTKDFIHLWNSQTLTDVVLVIGSKEFHVHKSLLSARVPKFSSMFEQHQEDRIEIDNIDADAFELFLKVIYGSKMLDKWTEKILPIANMYQMNEWKLICENRLCSQISLENVANFLSLADEHNASRLKAKSIHFIKSHVSSTLNFANFKALIENKPELFYEIFFQDG